MTPGLLPSRGENETVPTLYPKASPSEMQGLLVLLNDHKGSEDIALLADDLDLEIDEILPSLDLSEALGLVTVSDGRASLTDLGRKFLAGSIRARKSVLRDQIGKMPLFQTILKALEQAPEKKLSEEELNQLIDFTSAPADFLVQNIINWGRYAELFRYDADERELRLVKGRATGKGSTPPPASPPATPPGNPKRGAVRGESSPASSHHPADESSDAGVQRTAPSSRRPRPAPHGVGA